jgi:DNA ligase-1
MDFYLFADYLQKIESESSRNAVTVIIAELLQKSFESRDLRIAQTEKLISLPRQIVYMLKGRICADFETTELNFSNKSLVSALADYALSTGIGFDVRAAYGRLGDSGLMAEELLEYMQKNPPVQQGLFGSVSASKAVAVGIGEKVAGFTNKYTVEEVFAALVKLADSSGKGSQAQKGQIAVDLITQMKPVEGKYFARMLTGKLRLGVSDKTILDAISWAATGDKSLRDDLDRAYGLRADAGRLAEIASETRDAGDMQATLASLELEVGVPLAAQLVEREKDAEAIIARHGNTIVQPKYDGLRAQIHYRRGIGSGVGDNNAVNKAVNKASGAASETGGVQAIFSRNMEPLTEMFPEILEAVAQVGIGSNTAASGGGSKIDSIVLDGEIIGFDETTQTFMPFQQTIQRKRKYGVSEASSEIPVKHFVFDILYLNGEDLTRKSFQQRQQILKNLDFSAAQGKFAVTEAVEFTEAGKLEQYFRGLLDQGLEGIIAKSPESIYSPGKRGYDWIKLKANTYSDLKDTVDVVLMGYYTGKGNRAKHGIGGFLAGVYNPETDRYQTIAKIGSGVKDDEWAPIKRQLDQIALEGDTQSGARNSAIPTNYDLPKELTPDVIVAPKIVCEIDADEISTSKLHTAGYSLRFPRLKQFARQDKLPEQTTSPAELASLFALSS